MKRISAILFAILWIYSASAAAKEIHVLTVSGSINPGTADYLITGIENASEANAACVVIELDTPGGLVASTRDIIKAMLGARIPVIVHVTPSGGGAASAGAFITMAADVAVMSPGTNIGAAHPVGVGGQGGDDEIMKDKVTNDLVSYIRGIADEKGRDAEWAEKFVRDSASITVDDALKNNVIDLIAKDFDDLVRQLEGYETDKGVLELADAKKRVVDENFRTKILKTISDPNIAYILLMIGFAGLYFELSHPGVILPGVIGGIALILAFFSLQTLPVNYAGILLILLAVVFFIMEMKITSYGLLSIAGIVSLFFGSLMLFDRNIPGLELSMSVLLPTVLIISGLFIFVAGIVYKSHKRKPMTGATGLIGEIGEAKTDISPEGKVFVHGELWHAVSEFHIEKGTKIRIVKVENLTVEVEPFGISGSLPEKEF